MECSVVRIALVWAWAWVWVGCKPPFDLNSPPRIQVQAPSDADPINEGEPIEFQVRFRDLEGDAPLSARVFLDGASTVPLFEDDTLEAEEIVVFTTEINGWGTHALSIEATDFKEDTLQSFLFVVNGEPSEPEFSLTPAVPYAGDELVASLVTASIDPDASEGDEVIYSWKWYDEARPGSLMSDEGLPASVPGGLVHAGETWTFELTYGEGKNEKFYQHGIRRTLIASVYVENRPPEGPDTVQILPTAPNPSQDLVCSASGASDPDGDVVTYVFAWSRWEENQYVLEADADNARLDQSFVSGGDAWLCEATAYDGIIAGGSATDTVAISARTLIANGTHAVVITGDDNDLQTGAWAIGADLDGDPGNELLVATPMDSSEAPFAGAVSGLRRGNHWNDGDIDDPKWSFLGAENTQLGAPLGLVGDVDSDGFIDVAMGASGTASMMYVARGGVLPAAGEVIVPAVIGFDGYTLDLGVSDVTSLSVAGSDFDQDNRADVIVGIEMTGIANDVLVYWSNDLILSSTTSADAAHLIRSDHPDDGFGLAITSGDVTGDGLNDLIIGAPMRGAGTSVWVFDGDTLMTGTSTLLTDATWTISASEHIELGASVNVIPDITGDGIDDVAVGAPTADSGGQVVGQVGIISGGLHGGDVGFEEAFFVLSGTETGARFGSDIVVLGDTGTDGHSEIAVGAPVANSEQGTIYVFDSGLLRGGGIATADDAILQVTGAEIGDRLSVVGPAGDLDEDTIPDLILASPGHDPNSLIDAGAVYLFLTGQ